MTPLILMHQSKSILALISAQRGPITVEGIVVAAMVVNVPKRAPAPLRVSLRSRKE